MKVVFGGVADYARVDQGALNILGLRWILAFPSLPATAALVTLVLVLAPDQSEYGTLQNLSVEIIQPDGSSLSEPLSVSIEFAPPELPMGMSTSMIVVGLYGIEFKAPGSHKCRLARDGEAEFEFEFSVVA